jgi:hypothetical protein
VAEDTSTETEEREIPSIILTCPHCRKDFDTDKIQEIVCSACSEINLSIQTRKCLDCDNFYCHSCSEDNLNKHGYCEDCAEIECTYCESIRESQESDKYKACAKCEDFYCYECIKCFFDSADFCAKCTSEEKVTCNDCDNEIIKNKANLCKNFEQCGIAYCNDGNCKNLESNGYCEECNSFECAFCEDFFDTDQKIICTNDKCKKPYCSNCFGKIKDKTGNCIECSLEKKEKCTECGKNRYAGSVDECGNCRRKYCLINCDQLIPCAGCNRKFCSTCGSRCRICQKPYCNDCTKFKLGKCLNCQKEPKMNRKGIIERFFDWMGL